MKVSWDGNPIKDRDLAAAFNSALQDVFNSKLHIEKLPQSLPVAVFHTTSSLNGNAQGGRSSARWLLEESGYCDATGKDEWDCDLSISDFFNWVRKIPNPLGDHLVGILDSQAYLVDRFSLQKLNKSAPCWIKKSKADARFMPGSSNKRLPRFVASFQIMHCLLEHDIERSSTIAERWNQFHPKCELASALEKISGFTIDVGLNQLRRLCGDKSAIKIDRRLEAALPKLLGLPTGKEALAQRFSVLAPLIEVDGKSLTPAQLDHALWQWMSPKGT